MMISLKEGESLALRLYPKLKIIEVRKDCLHLFTTREFFDDTLFISECNAFFDILQTPLAKATGVPEKNFKLIISSLKPEYTIEPSLVWGEMLNSGFN